MHRDYVTYTRFTSDSAAPGRLRAVTRVAIVDPQPAVRAGLGMLLRTEPGLVPVGAATTAAEAVETVERQEADVVLLEHHLADGDGLSVCRRLKARPAAPRGVRDTAAPDSALVLMARVACADGIVDKLAEPEALFEAIRVVARGGTAMPPLSPEEMEAAAQRVEPEDLPLLAMLVDGTSTGDVADTLRLDRRKVGRRIERLLGRLRAGGRTAAA
jgi:DNA-binding NarL/FixJ family response regulator